MDISFFRSRRQGPELLLEDTVVNFVDGLTSTTGLPTWVACSPTIGAGMPDILLAYYEPQLLELSKTNLSKTHLLAFLRGVRNANLDTIKYCLKYSEKAIYLDLEELISIDAVHSYDGVFALSPVWKNIIPTIIAIEVKVHDWKKAVSQAARNKIFAHQSYVALPRKLVLRKKDDPIFGKLGIGLLSIDDDNVTEVIPAFIEQPRIWQYYYKLALLLANSRQDNHQCHSSYL